MVSNLAKTNHNIYRTAKQISNALASLGGTKQLWKQKQQPPENDENESNLIDDDEDKLRMTSAVTIVSVLRDDIPSDLVYNSLKQAAMDATTTVLNVSALVRMTLLSLAQHNISIIKRNDVQLKKEKFGFDITKILPKSFTIPIPSIHYGLRNLIFKKLNLPSTGDGPSITTATAVKEFDTNLQNMWSGTNIYANPQRYLIRILVRVHLAPEREQKTIGKSDIGAKTEKDKDVDRVASKLGPGDLVEMWEGEVEEEEREEVEEEPNAMEKGTTQYEYYTFSQTSQSFQREIGRSNTRRKGLIKALLRNPKIDRTGSVSDNELLKSSYDMSLKSDEIAVVKLITNQLLPYAPHSDSMCLLTQLPFILLANSILIAVGYHDHVQEISPIISPHNIHAIPINSAIIYETLTPHKNGIPQGPFEVMPVGTDKAITSSYAARKNGDPMWFASQKIAYGAADYDYVVLAHSVPLANDDIQFHVHLYNQQQGYQQQQLQQIEDLVNHKKAEFIDDCEEKQEVYFSSSQLQQQQESDNNNNNSVQKQLQEH
ncbi:hypothetical protein INT45_004409 [Circinella minor]|uniref:Uncharacterized protein n=1 Tax=Circinella minor TaxID=1195481 RepID=A0A8H7S6M0_9FUNG|nr:hypothetical protein INT45_004409 [Circinella minor]